MSRILGIAAAAAGVVVVSVPAHVRAGVADTKHNLSLGVSGKQGSTAEEDTCPFCHGRHSITPQMQRWNPAAMIRVYQPYSSTTLAAVPGQPTGVSKMCLGCHDGTIALDISSARRRTAGPLPARASLDTDLSDDHPISFPYDAALAARNPELHDPSVLAGTAIKLDGAGQLQCTTCHDPHDETNPKFLVVANAYADLCVRCHNARGWRGGAHESASTRLPRALRGETVGNPTSVAEAGCGSCHRTHAAGSHAQLLRDPVEEVNCLVCHDGAGARFDIAAELSKTSSHAVSRYFHKHLPREDAATMPRHVECQDCHNPHAANAEPAEPPFVSGALANVAGITLQGSPITTSRFEYEVCLRCHTNDVDVTIDRQIVQPDMRLQIDSWNPSYHPIAATGQSPDVPSLLPPLTAQSMIYCTDCHSNDRGPSTGGRGPRGPHGSVWPHLLERQYELDDGGSETYQRYELCYKCHNRRSILGDQSFPLHRQHIVDEQTSCATCHAAHGVPGTAENNAHLINFSTIEVSPASDGRMEFVDGGRYQGSCTLTCHDHEHVDAVYPAGSRGPIHDPRRPVRVLR